MVPKFRPPQRGLVRQLFLSPESPSFGNMRDCLLAARQSALGGSLLPAPSMWAAEAVSLPDGGRFVPFAYQREIMDTLVEPDVRRVVLLKAVRVGYTQMLNALLLYIIARGGPSALVVQPTFEEAKQYNKDDLVPSLSSCPAVAPLVRSIRLTGSDNTIVQKRFAGGSIRIAGASSGSGLRRFTVGVVMFDEVDSYPPEIPQLGDPVKMAENRAITVADRKLYYGGRPSVDGLSRLQEMFLQSDQRWFFVPCAWCGHRAPLKFRREGDDPADWFYLHWDKSAPQRPFFPCAACGQLLHEEHKSAMLAGGAWAPLGDGQDRGYYLWVAYSPLIPWSDIVAEWLRVKDRPAALQTFITEYLGEAWKAPDEGADWSALFARRETYRIGSVPQRPAVLVAGVDVQSDRLHVLIDAWGLDQEVWAIDYRILLGSPQEPAVWEALRRVLTAEYSGLRVQVAMIDSGYASQSVYSFCHSAPRGLAWAVKGMESRSPPVGQPSRVDLQFGKRRLAKAARVLPVSTSYFKEQLLHSLSIRDRSSGPSFAHFPEFDESFFQELTAERRVVETTGRGYRKAVWHKIRERNEALDCRVYSSAGAYVLGLVRMDALELANRSGALSSSGAGSSPASTARRRNLKRGVLSSGIGL